MDEEEEDDDAICGRLLRAAEELVLAGFAADKIEVCWSEGSVQTRTGEPEWSSPRPHSRVVPSRVKPANPLCLAGMPSSELLGLVAVADAQNVVVGRVVLYVCSSVLRVADNRALLYAHRLARECNLALLVVAFAERGPAAAMMRGEERADKTVRLECLANLHESLAALNVPLVVFSGSFCASVIDALAREIAVHAVVCDWAPGDDDWRALSGRPVVCFDSSFWTLRRPNVAVDTVQEACTDVMGQMMAVLPALGALSPVVQEMLLDSSRMRVFVPSSVLRAVVQLPARPWKHGTAAARTRSAETSYSVLFMFCLYSVERCMSLLSSCAASALIATELREQVGPWMLVAHVETGAISAAECLRALPYVLDNRQKRFVLQMLVAGREQRLLWLQHSQFQASSQDLKPAPDLNPEAPCSDPFFLAIHQSFLKTGVIHPLLLGYWLHGLPSPRVASAKALLARFGIVGYNYGVAANVLFELSLGEPRALEPAKKANIMRMLLG
jgi:hypothetical protein